MKTLFDKLEKTKEKIQNKRNSAFSACNAAVEWCFSEMAQECLVEVDTTQGDAVIYSADGNTKIPKGLEYDVNCIHMFMRTFFGDMYKGSKFTYLPPKSEFSRCVVIKSNTSWEAMYIDGICVIQNYNIDKHTFLSYGQKYHLTIGDIQFIDAGDADEEMLYNRAGVFPDEIKYLKCIYLQDGRVIEPKGE